MVGVRVSNSKVNRRKVGAVNGGRRSLAKQRLLCRHAERFCVLKKLHHCDSALLNYQDVGESIDRPGHRAGALKPPHAERNCIGFRKTVSKRKEKKGGGKKRS